MAKWEMVKLGEVCDVVSGSTPKTSDDRYWNGSYNWVTPAELNENTIEVFETDRKITELAIKETSLKSFPKGTVLLSSRAPIGKVAIAGTEMYCNQGFKNFICSERIYNIYLFWFLKSKTDFLNSLGRGATFKEISKTIVEKIKIPLPPLQEQQRMAKNLDLTSDLIKLYKTKLEELDKLIQSVFYDMFGDPVTNEKGWEVETLQQLIDKAIITYHLDGNHGGLYPRSEEFIASGIPYISANAIKNGAVDFSFAKYLSKERAEKFRKGVAQNEDVLFAHNATVGPVAILYTNEPYIILGTSLTSYRCNNLVLLPFYLKSYMESNGFKNQYIIEMSQTTRNQIPITTQRKYSFLLPPLPLQQKFADIVTKIEEQKAKVKTALTEAETLYNSLMQEYFE